MTQSNPWHSIPIGPNAPDIVQAMIEIPKASRSKYELDKETGYLRLDRVLFSSVYYPSNYGFIPRTYCDDNDPLDILVLTQATILPMTILRAKVIGVMRMIDGGEADDKIIAVCPDDMSVSHMNDIEDLPPHSLKELRTFFEDYKNLEHKTVVVDKFQNAAKAKEIVQKSQEDYINYMRDIIGS